MCLENGVVILDVQRRGQWSEFILDVQRRFSLSLIILETKFAFLCLCPPMSDCSCAPGKHFSPEYNLQLSLSLFIEPDRLVCVMYRWRSFCTPGQTRPPLKVLPRFYHFCRASPHFSQMWCWNWKAGPYCLAGPNTIANTWLSHLWGGFSICFPV